MLIMVGLMVFHLFLVLCYIVAWYSSPTPLGNYSMCCGGETSQFNKGYFVKELHPRKPKVKKRVWDSCFLRDDRNENTSLPSQTSDFGKKATK